MRIALRITVMLMVITVRITVTIIVGIGWNRLIYWVFGVLGVS